MNRSFQSSIIVLLLLFYVAPLWTRENSSADGHYNSLDAGLEERKPSTRAEKVYTLEQIERLRRAVSPRYIRVMDWRGYKRDGKVLTRGILFTYAGYRAGRVYLAGDFNNWKMIQLRRNQRGVYYHILPVREIEAGVRIKDYKYKFLVDVIWTQDPTHPNILDDGLGGYLSTFYLEREDTPRHITVRVLKEARQREDRLVEFAIYLPDVENLSIVGNFNHWNPEHDLLTKGEDGIFRLRLRLKPGEYVYKYVADGRWIVDPFNENTRYDLQIDELCSFLSLI